MGFLLFIVATLLWLPLTIINLVVVLVTHANSHGFFKVIDGYFKQTAVDIDRFGNHNFKTLLNAVLITKEGYRFGNFNETISSALGKNQRDETLTKTGKFICWVLDKLDPEHCRKSINVNM